MRRLGRFALVAVGLSSSVVACADLFGTPTQCTTDGDCARFNAICDVASAVCVARVQAGEAGVEDAAAPRSDGASPETDGSSPSPLDPCLAPNKPIAELGTVVAVGGDADREVVGGVTLDCTKDWVLRGRVVVRPGATLAIPAGTRILGDKATLGTLVAVPGARVVASGTKQRPVVFTSNAPVPAPGDWGGVFLLGAAPPAGRDPIDGDARLSWGGANPESDSGVLAFVRIEYGARGLVLGGVGRSTKIDSVEVRKTTDNCFTFVGGTVDVKHLACQAPADEFFDLSVEYGGRMQYLFGQRSPSNVAGTNGILVDGASPAIYNATLCGDGAGASQGYGIEARNGATLDAANLVVTGWLGGLDVTGLVDLPFQIQGSIASGNTGNPAFAETDPNDPNSVLFDDDGGFDEIAFFRTLGFDNGEQNPGLLACHDPTAPKPWPAAAITGGARIPPAGFFDTGGTYVGAFKDPNDTWLAGWTRFSPD